MMNIPLKIVCNRRGSVINVALLILILIFLVGIGLSKISTTDIKIATNLKTATTTFYEAESGLDAGSELLEQNIACTIGFSDPDDSGDELIEGSIMVTNLDFWRNSYAENPNPHRPDGTFDNTFNDLYYPAFNEDGTAVDRTEDSTDTYTNLSIGGDTRFSRGSAIQMAAGYEGLGKGSGGGGANIIYNVNVYRHGSNKSEATHTIQWVHKLGLGGDICKYN